jgi:hypothetical protein
MKIVSINFRTYAEEENFEAIFRRSGSEFIILRIPMTEKWPFQNRKVVVLVLDGYRRQLFFFRRKPILIQLPMVHIKITFLIFFVDRVPQLPAFNQPTTTITFF